MKKAIRVCSVLCIALLLVGIMSCSNGSKPDVWEKVTSINDIKGTWEGSMYVDILTLMGGPTGDTEYDAVYADASVKFTFGIKYPVEEGIISTLTTDFSNAVEKIAESTRMEPSEVRQMLGLAELSSTEEGTIPAEDFEQFVENASLTINQHKTKLKMTMDKLMGVETYIILEKK